MKAMNIITLYLGCRLGWIWFDRCGPTDIGLGEALPFCLDCSGMATFVRLLFLGIASYCIYRLLRLQPSDIQIHDVDAPPGRTFLIHWHRIVLLLALLSYPLWVSWVDTNTIIPGPDAIWITRTSCHYAGFKGTMLWGIVLTFVVFGFRILHRN